LKPCVRYLSSRLSHCASFRPRKRGGTSLGLNRHTPPAQGQFGIGCNAHNVQGGKAACVRRGSAMLQALRYYLGITLVNGGQGGSHLAITRTRQEKGWDSWSIMSVTDVYRSLSGELAGQRAPFRDYAHMGYSEARALEPYLKESRWRPFKHCHLCGEERLVPHNWGDADTRRQFLLERYGRDCYLCGLVIDTTQIGGKGTLFNGLGLSIDHRVPRARLGTDCPCNLRPTHGRCNSRRGHKDLPLSSSFVTSLRRDIQRMSAHFS
jgi:hypothetical protein